MSSFALLSNTSSPWFWVAWSLALVWQNYAFTRVSRARNSGSLKAHGYAALQSNGVWFLQSLFVYSAFMNILTGKAGLLKAVGAALYYTAFTMAGSLYAHYKSLKKEKGATAVGANKKYAQIPVEEWHTAQVFMKQLSEEPLGYLKEIPQLRADVVRATTLAEQAYDIQVGAIPDSGIAATKFDGATLTTGLPSK